MPSLPSRLALMFWAAFLVCGVSLGALAEIRDKTFNDIKYTDDMWSEEFLGIAEEQPVYLSTEMDFPIPDPPENGSLETMEELRVLRQYEKELRTPEQVKKIIIEQKGSTDLVFGLGREIPDDVLGPVEIVRYEATRDANHFIYEAKKHYKRARPTQLDPDLSLVIPVPGSAAYPSGHATISWLGGRVFSYIDPDNRIDYMRYAGDVGMRRSISGIHYPSDSVAGRLLADQVFEALLAVPAYREKIDQAKAGYQAFLGDEKASLDLNAITFVPERWSAEALSELEAEPVFLALDDEFVVPPPPANDSAETMRELTTLREYARTYRTPEQLERIKAEAGASEELLTGGPLVAQFDENAAFYALWPKAYRDVTRILMKAKRHYARPRPTDLAKDLTTAIDVPGHAAYPSGHATQMRLLARLMGAVDPAHEEEYLEMGYKIGLRREYAGLHYPSDTQAGINLADAVFEKLMENQEFQAELAQAKEAFDKTRGTDE